MKALLYEIPTDPTLNLADPELHPVLETLVRSGYLLDMSALMWGARGRTIKPRNLERGPSLGGVKLRSISGEVLLLEMYQECVFVMVPAEQEVILKGILDAEPQWDLEYDDSRIFAPFIQL